MKQEIQGRESPQLFDDQPIRTAWDEANETVTNCNALKLKSADGTDEEEQEKDM